MYCAIFYHRYSVASDPDAEDGQDSIELLLTVAKFAAGKEGEYRLGTCSRFIAEDLKPGDKVVCCHHPSPTFQIGLRPEMPVIMVANGSGIAPFR